MTALLSMTGGILISRTQCQTPRLRICLCGGTADLLLRACNQGWQQCKTWIDVLLLTSMLHITGRWEKLAADLGKDLWLSGRDKTHLSECADTSCPIVLAEMDITQAQSHIPSLSPTLWLFLVLLPFHIDQGHLAALQDSIQQAVILKIFWIVMWQGWPVLKQKQPSYGIWNWP